MMKSSVGIVLIHGIGRQRPGAIASEMSSFLNDQNPRTQADEDLKADSEGAPAIRRISCGGMPVGVCEANWAKLSDPDNPPEVRIDLSILRDFWDTVSVALSSSNIASSVRRLGHLKSPRRSLIAWGIGALIMTLVVIYGVQGDAGHIPQSGKIEPLSWAIFTPGLLIAVYVIQSMIRIVKFRYYKLRHASRLRRVVEAAGFAIEHLECYGFPLSNIIDPLRARVHARKLRDEGPGHDRAHGSARSGTERGLETRLYPLQASWPGSLAMRFFFAMQYVFLGTDLGTGYIMLCRKPG